MQLSLSRLLAVSGFLVVMLASPLVMAQGTVESDPQFQVRRGGDRPQPNRTRRSGAFVTTDSSAKRFEINSFEIQVEALDDRRSSPVITALAASPDGKLLAAAGDDHAIRILDIATGETLRTLVGHNDWIHCLAFAPDSLTLYSGADDGRVVQWQESDPTRDKLVARLPYSIRSLSISTEKHLLAIGGFSNEILLLNESDWSVRHRLQCDCPEQRCVRFSPDGTRVLCGGRDGEVRVWGTETGEVIAEFHEHTQRVHTAAFSSDGRVVISAGADRRLIQYDLEQKQVRLSRELAAAKLMSLCMITDDIVAVAGADNSIHLYDADSNSVLAHLRGHLGTVAVMVPCGDLLASGSFDTTIRIWDLESIDQEALSVGRPASRRPIKMDPSLRIR